MKAHYNEIKTKSYFLVMILSKAAIFWILYLKSIKWQTSSHKSMPIKKMKLPAVNWAKTILRIPRFLERLLVFFGCPMFNVSARILRRFLRNHRYRRRSVEFRPMLGTYGLDLGGIFIASHLLWHGASVFAVSSKKLIWQFTFYLKQCILKNSFKPEPPPPPPPQHTLI